MGNSEMTQLHEKEEWRHQERWELIWNEIKEYKRKTKFMYEVSRKA